MRFLKSNSQFKPIKDAALLRALNELSRTVNISATYGKDHPAATSALEKTAASLKTLFTTRTKFTLGSFNGVITLDEEPVRAAGTLMTALERRLARLRITSLKISYGITDSELKQLVVLLSAKEEADFKDGIQRASLKHISSDEMTLQSVKKGETVVNATDLSGPGLGGLGDQDNGVIDLDGFEEEDNTPDPDIHVDQIVAFLKGDIDDEDSVGKELEELAADPARLAKLIMDSVAIRQSIAEFSGESLGDIVLGCLRRTYDGLRKRPAFQTANGKADLRKALLLLEENILNKLRDLTEGNDPELDREIVQAIQEMDSKLGFEASALQYTAHKAAMEQDKENMMNFVKSQSKEVAEGLMKESDIPLSQWRSIIVESQLDSAKSEQTVVAGIETLATVFEKLEAVIKSADTATHDEQVKSLLGKANENLDDSIDTTREKLELLSRQLEIAKAGGTIGGQGRKMDQRELLAALAEVAQELMQPITAITASLEMMLHGFVGDITEEQRDLLGVAANSGEHLKYLMKELIDIVGCPTNKGVDNRFHTTSDEVVQMIDSAGQEHLNLGFFK